MLPEMRAVVYIPHIEHVRMRERMADYVLKSWDITFCVAHDELFISTIYGSYTLRCDALRKVAIWRYIYRHLVFFFSLKFRE